MATATEAASLNKTECDQLPTWKHKSSPILSVFQHFSLQHILCTKLDLVHCLYLPPPTLTKFHWQSPLSTVFQCRTQKWGEGSILYILKHKDNK